MTTNSNPEKSDKEQVLIDFYFLDAYNKCVNGELTEDQIKEYFKFILEVDYKTITTDEYFSISRFVQCVCNKYIWLLSSDVKKFAENVQNYAELMIIIEYSIATQKIPQCSVLDFVIRSLEANNDLFKSLEFEMSEIQQSILFFRSILLVKKPVMISDAKLRNLKEIDPSMKIVFNCIIPYAMHFNIKNLIKSEYAYEMIRDKTLDKTFVASVLKTMPEFFIKEYSELIARYSKTNPHILSTIAKYSEYFVKFPVILKEIATGTNFDLPDSFWLSLSKCNCKLSTDILKEKKCPIKYTLILSQTPQDFMSSETGAELLNNEDDEFILPFFENLNITTGNSCFFNNDALLKVMEIKYDSDKMKKAKKELSAGHRKTSIDLNKLCYIIVTENILNVDLYSDYLSRGYCCNKGAMVRYFVAHRAQIKTRIDKLAVSIEKNEFYNMVNDNPEWEDCYHTLVEMIVIRKCANPPIDDKYVPVRIPELVGKGCMLFNELPLFYTESMKNGFVPKNIYAESPAIQQLFFAGQLVNIPFESQIEWRYANLAQKNFMVILACSCLYYEPTEKFKECPLSFISSTPLNYVILIPLPFFLIALALVTHFFCQRCTRFLDRQITIYIILTFISNMVLQNLEVVPTETIKFIVKELEIFTLKRASPFINEYKKIINERMEKYGEKILRGIARDVTALETLGVFEVLDLAAFPEEDVKKIVREMVVDRNIYPEFRARIINKHFKNNKTRLSFLYQADKQKNWKGVYNISLQIGFNRHKKYFERLLSDGLLSPISLLIVASTKTAPAGDHLLYLTGVDRLIDTITSLMVPENEYNENIARLIQNVITRASSGTKETSHLFAKHFLELPFLSFPYLIISSLMETCASQEIYTKAWKQCFVRVTEDVIMKKDWRKFGRFSDVCMSFIELLFLKIVEIPGQLATGALLILIGQHSWDVPHFITEPGRVLELILQRGNCLEKADSNKKYGYDAFQTEGILTTILYTSEMRNVFFTETLPELGKFPIPQKIIIMLTVIHHLVDIRTQILTYSSVMDKLTLIAKETINVKQNMTNNEFKLLLVGIIFFATFAQIDQNLSVQAKSLCAALAKDKNFMVTYGVTDGTCTQITQSINERIIKFIFNLDEIPPLSQFSVNPRIVSFATIKCKPPLEEIEKPDQSFPGVSKHLPYAVQIRLANKYLPEKPKHINTAMYLELFKYGDFAVRYFSSTKLRLLLPQYVPIIQKATEAINKLVDVPDPEPFNVDYSMVFEKIPSLLEFRKSKTFFGRYIDTLVISLIPKYGYDIMKSITSARDSAFVNLCSIMKVMKTISKDNIDSFMKYIYPAAIARSLYKGSTRVGYSAISTLLKFKIPPNEKVISITKTFLASDERRVWFRGVKLIPLFPDEFKQELIDEAFKKIYNIQTISLFLDVCPVEGPKRSEMFTHILGKLLETSKEKNEDTCDILFKSLVSPYTCDMKKKDLFNKDPELWEIISKHIEWIWQMFKDKGKFADIVKFVRILPFSIRAMETRKELDNMIAKETMALFVIQNELKFESSMKIILHHLKTQEAIHSKIYIKFPEMAEPEAGGVLRGWLTSISEEIVSKDRNYFIPTQNNFSFTLNPKCEDLGLIEAIGRFIGLVVLHSEVLGYQISKHIIMQMIDRKVKCSDLKDTEPGVYQTVLWLQDKENDPEELFLDFTVNDDDGNVIELVEGGSNIDLTKENVDQYIEAITNYYLCKQCEKQINALKKGFQFVIKPSVFRNLSSKEVCKFICGEQKIDVEELIRNFEVIPPLTPDHPITKMFFNVIRKWDQKMLSGLFVFMTSAHIIPVGGYEFMKSKGRQPKLKLLSAKGDKLPLPNSLTCFSHLSIPPYKTEEDMEKGLITAITESEGFK